MSVLNRDEPFIIALKKNPQHRTSKDLDVICSRLHRFDTLSQLDDQDLRNLCAEVRYEWHDANETLYGKDDLCTCWYILLSGSIFIQGSMFLRNTTFGKQVPGSMKRGSQCRVLEPSEMIAIDYPDMHPPLHRNTSSEEAGHGTSEKFSSLKDVSSDHIKDEIGNGKAIAIHKYSSESLQDNDDYYYANDYENTNNVDAEEHSDMEEEDQDSISLHSSSSLVIKDLVIDVLKKDVDERNEDDHDVLLEFTRSLQAFSNMTEHIRRELCKVMVFAHVEKSGTILLSDKELLDSWSVIINGSIQILYPDDDDTAGTVLYMGESFGVTPNTQPQYQKGTMSTMVDDCQFVCIAQKDYCNVLSQGKENMENVVGEDGSIEMVTEKRVIEGGKKGHIVIRGTPTSLRMHLCEENSIDTTYAEDYLLTYRAFYNEPVKICQQLLDWFDKEEFQSKVTRIILLWVNNHFNDFERNHLMMDLLEKFEEKLQKRKKLGECRLFNIACSTKAKPRVISLTRSKDEGNMGFTINGGTKGYPIYILNVSKNTEAEEKGLKKGDQLLNVNGQNFEKLNMEKASAILHKNTDLTLTVKTNLFAFKEMLLDLKNPDKKKATKKTKHDAPFIAQISTMQPMKTSKTMQSSLEADLYDGKTKKDLPEDVIKVFKADQSSRFVFVNPDTTAEEAVKSACLEFCIPVEQHGDYSLCRVTVQNETFVKQSKLPDKWSKLSEIPLSARYYLKNNKESEQLLPDENIPDVLKEANYSFLDLTCFEVALHLTLQDYEQFQTIEQTDFIDDLFSLNEGSLANFKSFEDLVNKELFWVVSTICQEPNVMRRAKMIKHFVRIAQHCKALKNLNSTFAIISGLGYRAVSRMKSSWEKVPVKVQRTFDDLQSLMDPSRNMSKYRTLLNEIMSQPPVLPYVPVIKKDLTFLHLGNDTKVEGLVNFEKMRMIGREVRSVCRLCSADSSQIFSNASSYANEPERPSSTIYHTLTRRGRRSSFNNARRMYDDAINARRVKQYMQQLQIESDEDKLMEMSKAVEPSPVVSAQTKRKNMPSDSPSKSSKTLPGGANATSAFKRAQQTRNSEPQISVGPNALTMQAVRKKNPVSSLPKFGTSSPQAIKKLLALSEESGDAASKNNKRGSLEQRYSASSSSQELSPATSPYLSPKRDMMKSKESLSSSGSGHSIAHDNSNRNNNKGNQERERPIHRQGRAGSQDKLSVNEQSPKVNYPSSSPLLHSKHVSSYQHLRSHSDIPHSTKKSMSADSINTLDPQGVFHGPSYSNVMRMHGGEGIVKQRSLQHIGAVEGTEKKQDARPHARSPKISNEAPRSNNSGPNGSVVQQRTSDVQGSQGRNNQQDDIKKTFLSGSRGSRDAPLMRDKDPRMVDGGQNTGLVRYLDDTIDGGPVNFPNHPAFVHRTQARGYGDPVNGTYHLPPQRSMPYGNDVTRYYDDLRSQGRPRPPGSLLIHPGLGLHKNATTPDSVRKEFHQRNSMLNKSFESASGRTLNTSKWSPHEQNSPTLSGLPPRHPLNTRSLDSPPHGMRDSKGQRVEAFPHHLDMHHSRYPPYMYKNTAAQYRSPPPHYFRETDRFDLRDPMAGRQSRIKSSTNLFNVPFHCPRHGTPFINPGAMYPPQSPQSSHRVHEFSNLPLPPTKRNIYDVNSSRFQYTTQSLTQHSVTVYSPPTHAFSPRDVPYRGIEHDDRTVPSRINDMLDHDQETSMNDRYIESYAPIAAAPPESSFIHKTPPVTPRRKSSEWAIAELDKENQQQAMQVWNSSSTTVVKNPKEESNRSKPPITRKKPSLLLNNSSTSSNLMRQLSDSTLSPLSSPLNSPATPVSSSTNSMAEVQVRADTMTNGEDNRRNNLPEVFQHNLYEYDDNTLTDKNSTPIRTLPSYNEALTHLSFKSPISPPNSDLPTYQAHQELKETKERSSHV